MECYEKGLLSKSDTDGLELTWGNQAAIVELTRKICEREGFRVVLADGCKKASEKIGGRSEKFCRGVKGLELPMHDPRGFTSWAVTYATTPRGAVICMHPHSGWSGGLLFSDLGYDKQLDRFVTEGKGVWAKVVHDYCEVLESLVVCKFSLCANVRGSEIF